MALAIDSVVPGALSIKMLEWILSYHAQAGMPLHTHSDLLKSSCDSLLLMWELIFIERQFPGINF